MRKTIDSTSNSQKIRMLSESWVYQNGFCPYCGMEYLEHFRNNAPVADFYCPQCAEEYELKSKNGSLNSKISDGAYVKMIERIQAVNNPNFFFLQYAKPSLLVENFFIVPKHFFSTGVNRKAQAFSGNSSTCQLGRL